MKALEEALLKARTHLSINPDKILTLILEDRLEEYPWYYDLIEDRIYGSDALKEVHGIPDSDSMTYDELLKVLEYSDSTLLEQMKIRCLQELKRVEFIFVVQNKFTKRRIRMFTKMRPLLNSEGNVIAIYGTDRILETLDSEEMK